MPTPSLIRLVLATVLTLAASSLAAADLPAAGAPVAQRQSGHFPQSAAALAIRAEQPCWRGCQAYCGRGFQSCLRQEGLDACVPLNDRCDRACVAHCRLSGGPLITLGD
jgi:hypothetical protein